MISLTRSYTFSASHRLHSDSLSDAENARLYGKCNNPYGHGHDYLLQVTVSGTLDPLTGLVVPLSHLDRLVNDCILARFAHCNFNLDIAEFSELVPTTENIALVTSQLLQRHWDAYISSVSARLARIYIQETERNGFEVLLPAAPAAPADLVLDESVTVNA